MKNRKFSFIMEFDGGTYISQIDEISPEVAMKSWAKSLDVANINGMNQNMKEEIIAGLDDEEPVGLEGLTKIWCFTIIPEGHFGLIHFVETAQI